jgi:hypothetical protein
MCFSFIRFSIEEHVIFLTNQMFSVYGVVKHNIQLVRKITMFFDAESYKAYRLCSGLLRFHSNMLFFCPHNAYFPLCVNLPADI